MSNAIDPTKTTSQLEENYGFPHWNDIILWDKRQKKYRVDTKNRSHSDITIVRSNRCSTKMQKPCVVINIYENEPTKEVLFLVEHKYCLAETRLPQAGAAEAKSLFGGCTKYFILRAENVNEEFETEGVLFL